ncbi:MAG: hypothetical protein JXA60_05870 [Candidatus Coatesbacteria bacterium]|nr:hypothetical protein [Candidatus Coatesbacteria bacterium]
MKNSELRLVSLEEAARIVGKKPHNIRDYIQRGRISKYDTNGKKIQKARNGELRVSIAELESFLDLVKKGLEKHHHSGLDIGLGFHDISETERTKHVHRLHPYLGKFIPQLVEWFLKSFFRENDLILDPFMGSGTTLVQSNELGINSIGIDISEFNCLISRVKTQKYDIEKVTKEINDIESRITKFSKYLTRSEDVDLSLFPEEKMRDLEKSLLNECNSEYLRKWFARRTLLEMLYYKRLIREYHFRDLLKVLLSRSIRSSRLIPHYDLATPKSPLPPGKEYWCRKHNRMCKPIEECLVKIHTYSIDTIRRIREFDRLRTDKEITIIQDDSRQVDLEMYLHGRKIDGIFTSPPYVGQIDYHEQHIYAYELFGLKRNDSLEIGQKKKGKSKSAQEDYIRNISESLINLRKYLKEDSKIFIVANDRYRLYQEIAKRSNLRIEREFHRAVTKRTEQGDNPYEETILFLTK